MASFFSDDPKCGSSLEELMEKEPRHIWNLLKTGWKILAPIVRNARAGTERARLKAAAEAMQRTQAHPSTRIPNPALAPPTFMGLPNRNPPPRRKHPLPSLGH